MALNSDEQLLAEAFDSYMLSGEQLGLKQHAKEQEEDNKQERGFEYLHEQINELFHQKAASLTHYNGVCAAFAKVHGYKYLDDPSFAVSLDRELASQGVSSEERLKAGEIITTMCEELERERDDWREEGSGWHPDLDQIADANREAGLPD